MLISKLDLYKSEWLDLVFDKRNKNYGAYELRQHYANNMTRAITVTIFIVTGAVFTASFIAGHRSQDIEKRVDVIIPQIPPAIPKLPKKDKIYEAPTHAKPAPKPLTPAQPINTQRFVVPKVEEHADTEPPTIAELNKTAIGPITQSGGKDANNVPAPSGNGTDNSGTAPADGNGTGIVDVAEVSPEPIGGASAWSRFLQKNLHYPAVARENGVQGRVIVSFVVETDGHLSDIKVLKGIGSGCDEEAVRVLKLAPAWKPGMQNGQKVRVRYTIPMNFQLAED